MLRSALLFSNRHTPNIRFFSKKNFEGNAKAWPCEIIKMSACPNKSVLASLPINSNAGFIRSPKGWYFVNKLHEKVKQVKATEAALQSLDNILNPTNESRVISEKELDDIKSLTGFCMFVNYFTTEETRALLQEVERQHAGAERERNTPGSTMGPW